MWPFARPKKDPRGGRLVFLIECLLNQNARDLGAAVSPAVTREMMDILADARIGMVHIPCPEMPASTSNAGARQTSRSAMR